MRVVSHESAAELWGLPLLRAPAATHLTVPPDGSRHARPGEIVHRTQLRPGDCTSLRGQGVTSPLRTLADLSRCLPAPEVVALADAALARRLVTVSRLRTTTIRGPGSRRWAEVVTLADGKAQSVFESLTRVALVQAGFGPVISQPRLAGEGHPYDLGLPWARLLIECDSHEHHRSRTALTRDRAHSNAVAAERGWNIVRLVWAQVWPDPRPALAVVEAAVLAGSGPRVRQRRYRRKITTNEEPGHGNVLETPSCW